MKNAMLILAFPILVSAACGASPPGVKQQAKPWFPVGVWFEGNPDWGGYPRDRAGAKSYYDRCFADLAAHGFNAATVPNCPELLWPTLLHSAQGHGVRIVLEIGELVRLVSRPEPVSESEADAAAKSVFAGIGRYQSLARYQIRDEPPPEMMPNWLLVRRVLANVDPKRPAFSCFNHPASLARAGEQANLSEAVFDIYPHGVNTPPQSLGGFIPALDGFKSAARDLPLWPVLQSFAKPEAWRYPSAQELRAVTYLSLAAGAKGIFYFLYQTMPNHPERLQGLVDADGNPTPIYGPATLLARELGKLAPLLLSLKPAQPPDEVEGEARVGSFVEAEGRSVLIVASVRPDRAVTAVVSVGRAGVWRDALSGENFEPATGRLNIPLAPGGGRVLVQR